MFFVGLDVHKKVVEAAIIDQDGKLVQRDRFPCTRSELLNFAKRFLSPEAELALEATTNTWAVVDILQPFVSQVVVSNPLRTKAIAEAKIKTDKVDALVLAQLLRVDYLPKVWIPDSQTRIIRQMTSHRASLVGDRTRIKNRIHAVLHQRLIPLPVSSLFSVSGMAWLRKLDLDPHGRDQVDSELALLDAVQEQIQKLDKQLALLAYRDEEVKLLMTLFGVDTAVAQSLRSTLGDIDRFESGDHAASCLGLTPSVKQSAGSCYYGPITKRGKAHARWMVIQAAQHFDRQPGPLGVFFRKIAKKKNRNVAVVATARKLVVIAWHMLKNHEPYRYSQPRSTGDKLARLRIAATGKRRKGGHPKGSGRPASYGTGQNTRGVKSLSQVYASENLPPNAQIPPGERRMLAEKGLTDYVQKIDTPHRIPR
ncbi:MAG: IS110 family transposase [Acidobacteriota bacterium]|nr:IS110 family transposase [Acidobacteriota bacterium]